MKRLIKKSVFFNAVKDRSFYYEIYKNPTTGDLNKIKKGDPSALSLRGIMTFDGTVYVWSGSLLHKDAINQGDLPEGLHFDFDGKDLDLYIVPGIIPEDLYDIVTSAKNNLASLNIGDNAGIMINTKYYGAQRYPLYDEIQYFNDILTKMPSLATIDYRKMVKKSEFFDADQINVNYVEVFKNPSLSEVSKLKSVDGSYRGVIDFGNKDIYVWRGEALHDAVLNDQKLKVPDGIHFVTDGSIIGFSLLSQVTPQKFQDAVSSAKNKLSSMGINGSTQIFEIDTNYYGAEKHEMYNSLNTIDDVINMEVVTMACKKYKRLIKKAKFYSADKIGGYYVEVFKNPSSSETTAIKELKESDRSVRGIITFDSNDIYIWRGDILHNRILNDRDLQVSDGLHFVLDSNGLYMYLLSQFNPEMLQEMFLSAKSKLANMGVDDKTPIDGIDVNYYGGVDYHIYNKYNTVEDIFNMEPSLESDEDDYEEDDYEEDDYEEDDYEEDDYEEEFDDEKYYEKLHACKKYKRLIKKAKFYSADKIGSYYVEVFKNPSSSEASDVKKINSDIRGIIDSGSNDVYIWQGDILHNRILNNDNLKVPDGLHFAFGSDGIYFYIIPSLDPKTVKNIVLSAKSKLANIGIDGTTLIDGIDTSYYGAIDYDIYDKYKTLQDILDMEPDVMKNGKQIIWVCQECGCVDETGNKPEKCNACNEVPQQGFKPAYL